MNQFSLRWDQFWFESNQPLQFGLFRRIIGLVLLGCYSIRTFDLKFFYSNSGFLPANKIAESIFMDGRYSLLIWLPSDTALWIFHILFLLSLLGMALKIFPRISACIALILHISFLHRTLIIAYGVDLISAFFLFFLCFVDDRKEDPSEIRNDSRSVLSSVALRLVQIQLCVIYGFGGLEKLKGTHWWRGEAVWDMMANVQIARFDATWIAHFPSVIVVLTFSALLFEVYFPVLVWIKPIRPFLLIAGLIMHLMIMITVDIPYFSLLMMSAYVLFLKRETLLKLRFLNKI